MFYFNLILIIILHSNSAICWKEASKCTSGTSSNTNLKLDCGNDLIFIAWTHYGHQTTTDKLKRLNKTTDNCYFYPKDCTVSVDYVANECNGLSSCQISLDAQYLHSCKSYSNYLFIVYDCIEATSTVNVCDSETKSLNSNEDNFAYLKTPNYPNEYFSNLDCNCTMRTQKDSSIQIEILEFDLESSSETETNQIQLNSLYELSNPKKKPQLNPQTCLRDYFILNSNTQLCGSLSPFSSLLNIKSSNESSKHQMTNFRFYSDDALTRRGFWLKVKVSQLVNPCPENFMFINNMCIRVYDELLTWYEAHTYCLSLGFSLALIDNFELEKQINKAMFNEEDELIVKKFWIGIRQLNQSNWFDFRNKVINFRDDEKNWWPWLIVDSGTYNQGSCVAKKRNAFFLEDCYKRMPFACEYKRAPQIGKENSNIQLKCGKAHDQFLDNVELELTTTPGMTTTQKNLTNLNKNFTILPKQSNSKNEANLRLKDSNSDSTLLIGLVFVISILIASINTIVIIFICKRRKLLIKQEQNENADKDSKMSQDTINSSQNMNLDDGSLTLSGLNTSLSYNCLSSVNQANLLLNNTNEAYNFLNTFNNCNNLRRSVFVPKNSTINPCKGFIGQTNQLSNTNDPLGHIYETISVSSVSNANIPSYNPRFNQRSNFIDTNKNPYNEIDSEFQQSMVDSSACQKSQELFLINLNNNGNNNGNNKQFQHLNLNKNFAHLNPNQQFLTQFRYSSRNPIMNNCLSMSTTNTSPSCSSTGTTTTGADVFNNFNCNTNNRYLSQRHQNFKPNFHVFSNDPFSDNNSINNHFGQRQHLNSNSNMNFNQHLQRDLNETSNMFTSRAEAVV